MAKSNELQSRVVDWLRKQGYPLEMEVAKTLAVDHAHIVQGDYYTDLQSDKPREIDVVATWSGFTDAGMHAAQAAVSVVVECKAQQEGPWIVFTSGATARPPRVPVPMNADAWNLVEGLNPQLNLLGRAGRLGYGLTQAFRSRDGTDTPYAAVMTAAKAAQARVLELTRAFTRASPEVVGPGLYLYPCLVIPVVVTDAPIFECSLDQRGELLLTSVPHAGVEWRYPIAADQQRARNAVRIYGVSALPAFLEDVRALKAEFMQNLPIWLAQEIQARSGDIEQTIPGAS